MTRIPIAAAQQKSGASMPHERTDWLTVVAYGKLAELCHQHLKKGRQIYVEGSIRVREAPTEGGRLRRPEIVASRVQFLGSPPGGGDGRKNDG